LVVSQDIKCTLKAYDHHLGATATSLRNSSSPLQKSFVCKPANRQRRAPSPVHTMNPLSLPVRDPSSWPNSPSCLFPQPASPTPSSSVRQPLQWVVGQVQRLQLLRPASMVDSVGSKGITTPASSWKWHKGRTVKDYYCSALILFAHTGTSSVIVAATLFNSLKRLLEKGVQDSKLARRLEKGCDTFPFPTPIYRQ
jgi:hypothetical protein